MSKDKCCENCKHFKDVDADGFGLCNRRQFKYRPYRDSDACEHYEILNGSWTEITPDNVDEVYEKPVVVAWQYEGKSYYRLIGDCMLSPLAMSMNGGYYYYVLPELKIE